MSNAAMKNRTKTIVAWVAVAAFATAFVTLQAAPVAGSAALALGVVLSWGLSFLETMRNFNENAYLKSPTSFLVTIVYPVLALVAIAAGVRL